MFNSHRIIIVKDLPSRFSEDDREHAELYITDDGIMSFYFNDLDFDKSYFDIVVGKPFDKIRYAIASLASDCFNDRCNQYLGKIAFIAKKLYPNFSKFEFETYKQTFFKNEDGKVINPGCVKEEKSENSDKSFYFYYDGIKRKEVFMTTKYVEYRGTVADGAKGFLERFLKDKNISLEDFIRNDNYCIICDSMNDSVWNKFKSSLMYNAQNVIEEYC